MVTRSYWWPGMGRFIKRYVEGCAVCQQNKVITHPLRVPLEPLDHAKDPRPFAQISIDLVVKLPKSDGFDSVLTIVDQGLSKMALFIPCNESIDALGIAQLLSKHVYARYGMYDAVISDRGPQFASKVTKELYGLLGIERKLSTAYHPQTDGQTERLNQELEIYLRIFTTNEQDRWVDWLHLAEFTHNNRVHSSKGMSPFYIVMGYNPKPFPQVFRPTNVPELNQRLKLIGQAQDEALAAHRNSQQMMKDRFIGKTIRFNMGDKVWLDAGNLRLQHGNRKLAPKRYGPFKITKVLTKHAYQLQLPKGWGTAIHPVFHISVLTPYRETVEYGRSFPQPAPDLIEGQEEWEIDQIISHRTYRGRRQYLVSWKGYPPSENTWLPPAEFKHAQTVLNAYKKKKNLP